MYKYTLAVTSPEYWNEIHNALIIDSNEDGIPDRKVTCTDSKNHSPTRGTYWLTEDEANEIAKHPNIKWIELSPSDYPESYPKPEPLIKRFKKNVKVYRDLGFNAPPTTATSSEEQRTNWAMKRVGIVTNGDSWPNVTGQPAVINSDVSFSLTGKNVDLIIQDSGVLQYHPEFIGSDGKSRVRDVILDGPYYIDPNYFTSNNLTYTKPDGRIGITTLSAHAWWENSGSRSASFSSLGTISIPNNYTVTNALGTGGLTHSMNSSHGTGCAGLSGGKNFGLAFESELWTISIFSPANINTDSSYDAIKILHQNKPINPATGRKNPTVVNGSWGYYGGFNSGTTVNYSFKGSTGSFTGYDSSSTGVQALAQGLLSGQYYNRQFSSSSRSNSIDTAGDEMVDAGVIFVAAAGNDNQRLGIGNDDPHLNDYLTSLNGGDSRSGFPSASQSGTLPSGHRNWIHPQRNGYNATDDFHPTICVGAMDEFIRNDYKEQKAAYSNNGPGIDVYAPADETLSAGISGLGDINYDRYNSDFVDMFFNGTSAAAPVVTGLIALFLQSKPDATSAEVKDFIKGHGSQKLSTTEWRDDYPNNNDADYWRQYYNNRGAASRVLFNPFANDTIPKVSGVIGGESIITSDLVLNLDANNYTSGSTWTDTSGQGNNGTINGATYNSGNGGYFDFDGTNDSISFTNTSDFAFGTGDFTIEAWVRFAAVGDGGTIAETRENAVGNPAREGLGFSMRSNRITIWSGVSNTFIIDKTLSLSLNTWHHVIVSRSSGTLKSYINGVEETSSSNTQDFTRGNLFIGRNINDASTGGTAWGNQDQAQLRIYKGKGFTGSEVLQNYNALRGRYEDKPLILSGISYSFT